MTGINKMIIEYIKDGKSLKEIGQYLSMSEKQLYVRIKQLITSGYMIEPSYSYDSNICFNLKKDDFIKHENKVKIHMSNDDNLFRCIVIADLHIGSIDFDIKLADSVYEYAAKNGINNILICGDIMEGDYTSSPTNIKGVDSQAEYFVKKYPYDRNINNFAILGNHDHYSLKTEGYNIAEYIKNNRYDIVPIGHGQGSVNVKQDNIVLFHKLYDGFKLDINTEKIVLSGHSHMMKTKLRDIFWIGIPTLSNKSNDKTKEVIPGFVDLSINIENDIFEYAEAKHMIITPKIVQVSEVRGKVKTLFNDTTRK